MTDNVLGKPNQCQVGLLAAGNRRRRTFELAYYCYSVPPTREETQQRGGGTGERGREREPEREKGQWEGGSYSRKEAGGREEGGKNHAGGFNTKKILAGCQPGHRKMQPKNMITFLKGSIAAFFGAYPPGAWSCP